MKGINARTALISLFLGFTMINQAKAEDYYIYQTPKGELVISNQEPPLGSKIIKRISFPDTTDNEVQQSQQPNNPQPNEQTGGSAKPSKTK